MIARRQRWGRGEHAHQPKRAPDTPPSCQAGVHDGLLWPQLPGAARHGAHRRRRVRPTQRTAYTLANHHTTRITPSNTQDPSTPINKHMTHPHASTSTNAPNRPSIPPKTSDFARRMAQAPQQLRRSADYALNAARHARLWTTLALYDLIRVGCGVGVGGGVGVGVGVGAGCVCVRGRDRSWMCPRSAFVCEYAEKTKHTNPPSSPSTGGGPLPGRRPLQDTGEQGGGPDGDGEGAGVTRLLFDGWGSLVDGLFGPPHT
jgi:hypothetical protein